MFEEQIKFLNELVLELKATKDLGEKQELLLALPSVNAALLDPVLKPFLPQESDLSSKIALYSVIAIEQHPILFAHPKSSQPSKEKIRTLFTSLIEIDRFYESIGGIVGYHLQVLKLLAKKNAVSDAPSTYLRAPGIDLTEPSERVGQAVLAGIQSLDEIAEIYPIGGLGSRLNLISKKNEPLPAACLPFCGRSLLEGLIRDVQAKEFLYHRLYGRQITIPIAMMTSLEKNNAVRIESICEKKRWFGRPKESFMLFTQLSVPVITHEGKWSMKAPLQMNLQPGGHGALWKAAEEKGVFFWLQKLAKHHVLIRQINNPIAGLDNGLLALTGVGKLEQKTFGFASCERVPHAAEGALVLVQEGDEQRLSNIEYTDFKKFAIDESRRENGFSLYPANTNILYANLERILPVIQKNPLPGLILNMKNKEPYLCPAGLRKEELAGRLESMMQNISDALLVKKGEFLPTFLTYNERKKTISAAKKSFERGKEILETPEGAFYDLLANSYDLLKNYCGAILPPFSTQEEYLNGGPSLLFLYHPALGPLYSLIAQKIKRPAIQAGSELQLEIADALIDRLSLDGSLLINAEHTLGHDSQGITRYSQKTGKCVLKNVTVVNRGINRKLTQGYWKNQLKRYEALTIHLKGHSEFYAENVTFLGAQSITVPDGERWIAEQDAGGAISFRVEKAGWRWEYKEEGESLKFLAS